MKNIFVATVVGLLLHASQAAVDAQEQKSFPVKEPEKLGKKPPRDSATRGLSPMMDCDNPNLYFCGADSNGEILYAVCTSEEESMCVSEAEASTGMGGGKGNTFTIDSCGCCPSDEQPFCSDTPRLVPNCDFDDFSCDGGVEFCYLDVVKKGKEVTERTVCGDPLTGPDYEKGAQFLGCGADCQVSSFPSEAPTAAPSTNPSSSPSMQPTDSCLACTGDPTFRYIGVDMTQAEHQEYALAIGCDLASIMGDINSGSEGAAARALLDRFVQLESIVWAKGTSYMKTGDAGVYATGSAGPTDRYPALYECCAPAVDNAFASCAVPIEPQRCVFRSEVGTLRMNEGTINLRMSGLPLATSDATLRAFARGDIDGAAVDEFYILSAGDNQIGTVGGFGDSHQCTTGFFGDDFLFPQNDFNDLLTNGVATFLMKAGPGIGIALPVCEPGEDQAFVELAYESQSCPCGPNAISVLNGMAFSCECPPGFFEVISGAASTLGCVNPCSSASCPDRSLCIPESADSSRCVEADITSLPTTISGDTAGTPVVTSACNTIPTGALQYTLMLPTTTAVTATLCGGAIFDTVLYVERSNGSNNGGLCLLANDDRCGTQSAVTWTALANTAYIITVAGFSCSSEGPFTLSFS